VDEAARPSEPAPEQEPAGTFRADPWGADGRATLTAAGPEPQGALLAGLRGVLALALAGHDASAAGDDTAAAPIAGDGDDLAAVFARLADDLFAQLETFGGGLDHVRLDGLLETDDGGYSAWGYVVGRAGCPPPLAAALDGAPSVGQDEAGRVELRVALRRG
jgi:hypothetical protein